ncbi:related to integral membrane protein [Phialocephala subalpina]|uniref:Related to integral membrane protein n=1 Tax=Phialocephala subalpina TaxID=576137 RepID=A0A1L7WY63_9HELO|nr:related to integral membrane protein [Phialocephala subalpina]
MVTTRGEVSRSLNICLITFSTIFVILRFYVRCFMTKVLGLDDAFSFLALPVLIAQSSLEIREVSYGAGEQITTVSPENLKKFFSLLPTMQLLYFIGIGLVRLSIIAFLPRLWKERKVTLIAWALGFAVFAMSITCFFIMLFECKHIPDLWDKAAPGRQCLSSQHEAYMFWTHSGIGVFIDILLLVIPLWIISTRMVVSTTKKRVLLVFSVGLFVVITGAVRLGIIVTTNFAVNTTFFITKTSIWTDLEGHVGLWVACFPTLQPLLRIVVRSLGLSSNYRTTTQPKPSSNMGGFGSVTWKRRSQGYMEHHTEPRRDSISDDCSGKCIVRYEEREFDLEMNSLGSDATRGRFNQNSKGIVRTTDIEVRRD